MAREEMSPLQDTLKAIQSASLATQMSKLLSYKAVELSMAGGQQGRSKEFSQFESILSIIEDAAGDKLTPGQATQWLRDRDLTRLSSTERDPIAKPGSAPGCETKSRH